jgi:hypothetical protein
VADDDKDPGHRELLGNGAEIVFSLAPQPSTASVPHSEKAARADNSDLTSGRSNGKPGRSVQTSVL